MNAASIRPITLQSALVVVAVLTPAGFVLGQAAPPARAPGDERPAVADWLGISSLPLAARERAALKISGVEGVAVAGVYPDSPASAAGLRTGDVIVAINGRDISTVDDLRNWSKPAETASAGVQAAPPPAGDKVDVVYEREQHRWRVELRPTQPPTDLKASLLKPAEAGQAWAQYELADALRNASPPDVDGARRWLKKAADQKLAAAQATLGLMLLVGEGGPPDVDGGANLLKAAGNAGLTSAQHTLGLAYCYGLEVPRNLVAAAYWFREAAGSGYGPSQFMMACLYEQLAPPDHVGALYWLKKACEQKMPEADAMMSVFHRNGWGVAKSDEDANRYLLAAANAGHAPSQFLFGQVCSQGQGVQQDLETAVGWYRVAASKGDVDAMNALGMCYKNGEGVVADPEEAKRWLEKAAESGDAAAQFNRAMASPATEEAVVWMKKAAASGVAEAQYMLAMCYGGGYGVPKSKSAAAFWYRKAIAQGHAEAKQQYEALFRN